MSARVPHVYHFVFGLRPQTEPFHLMHYLCLASCIGVNKPDAVMFHCHNEPWGEHWDRIKPSLTMVPLVPDQVISKYRYSDPKLDRLRYAHLSDVARLEILAEHGGIYADMDTLFISPPPPALRQHGFVMGHEFLDTSLPAQREAGGSLCNAYMMSEPGAPFVREWLARTHDSFDGTWNAHSTLLPYRLSQEHPDWIHVEPERSFFYFDWNRPALRRLFRRDVSADLGGVYSVHLSAHMWWEPNFKGTSIMNANRLTPAYVRHAATTYAALARPYLPADVGRQDAATWRAERLAAACEDGARNLIDLPGKLERRVRKLPWPFGAPDAAKAP